MINEIYLIATRDLLCNSVSHAVFERKTCKMMAGMLCAGQFLGFLESGPDLPIMDLDIIQQWRDLQEYAASTARK